MSLVYLLVGTGVTGVHLVFLRLLPQEEPSKAEQGNVSHQNPCQGSWAIIQEACSKGETPLTWGLIPKGFVFNKSHAAIQLVIKKGEQQLENGYIMVCLYTWNNIWQLKRKNKSSLKTKKEILSHDRINIVGKTILPTFL